MAATGPDPGCFDAAEGWNGQPLDTANLILRPPVAGDLPALVTLAGNPEVALTTAVVPHPYTEKDGRAFLALCARPFAETGVLTFAVERRIEAGLIGCAAITDRGEAAEVGYWIGQPYWGRGYATEAVNALLRLALGNFSYRRVEAGIMVGNAASQRVLTKAGFVATTDHPGSRGRCAGVPVRDFVLDREAWRKARQARPNLLVAAVALVDADGRVLIARRPEDKPLPGLWEFPGGKVKADETPEAALVRELAEELGIDVGESCLAPVAFASHGYDRFHLLMPLYACRVWKGEIAAREGQALKWVRPSRLGDYPMPPADKPLIALLQDLL